LELKAIDAAIVTAKQNLAAAKANESRAAEKRAAIELRGFAKQLREAGKKRDAGLLQLAEGRRRDEGRGRMPWARAFEHIRPTERRNFMSFVSQWAASLEREVANRLISVACLSACLSEAQEPEMSRWRRDASASSHPVNCSRRATCSRGGDRLENVRVGACLCNPRTATTESRSRPARNVVAHGGFIRFHMFQDSRA